MERAEIGRKVGTPDSLIDLRAEDKRALSGGPMPIDKAMQMLAAKGRLNASPDIMPSASKDPAPLEGWSKLPGQVPPAFALPPPELPPTPSASAALSASAAPSAAPAPSQKPHQP
jgi:hypothetical protein